MLDYVKFEIISFRCEVQKNVVGVKKLGTDEESRRWNVDRAQQLLEVLDESDEVMRVVAT